MMDPLFRKGLLFKSKKKDTTRYYRPRHLMQLHDATAVANDASPRMLDLWKQFMATEWDHFTRKLEELIPDSVLRVIPINASIDTNSQVLAFEDVREIVAGSRCLAVTRCSCRVIDGACGKPLEVCLQIDKAADYAIERGTGREVTKEEALSMLKMCAEEGLVHVSENKRASGTVICNCCADCCMNWTSIKTGLGKFCAPSRFRASVDPEACNGCEECLDVCFFDSIGMDGKGDVAAVSDEKCMGCGLCRAACPTDAISMEVARPEGFVPA
jgi:NAD-dependent dihydropyrimidine dehydrogenase PreA subunit